MGTQQHHKFRVTFSISRKAHEKLKKVNGSKSAWVDRLITGAAAPPQGVDPGRLDILEQRLQLIEMAMTSATPPQQPNRTDSGDGIISPQHDTVRSSRHDSITPQPDDGVRSQPHENIGSSDDDYIIRSGMGRRGSKRAADPRFQARVCELRRGGSTYKQIITQLHTSAATVSKILAQHGMK